MKRLFVGLNLEDPARKAAESVLQSLSEQITHQGLRWVRPDKLHLTLAFLGDVQEDLLPSLTDSLARLDLAPFPLQLAGLGAFPDMRRPRVIWLGISDSAALRNLQLRTVQALPETIPMEEREFSPHITLARLSPGSPTVGRQLQSFTDEMEPLTAEWDVRNFCLIESAPAGAYEELHSFPLRGAM